MSKFSYGYEPQGQKKREQSVYHLEIFPASVIEQFTIRYVEKSRSTIAICTAAPSGPFCCQGSETLERGLFGFGESLYLSAATCAHGLPAFFMASRSRFPGLVLCAISRSPQLAKLDGKEPAPETILTQPGTCVFSFSCRQAANQKRICFLVRNRINEYRRL